LKRVFVIWACSKSFQEFGNTIYLRLIKNKTKNKKKNKQTKTIQKNKKTKNTKTQKHKSLVAELGNAKQARIIVAHALYPLPTHCSWQQQRKQRGAHSPMRPPPDIAYRHGESCDIPKLLPQTKKQKKKKNQKKKNGILTVNAHNFSNEELNCSCAVKSLSW
jgi:hypothetical protein